MARLAICLAVASLAAAADPVGPLAPWGAHLAYGVDPQTSMSVMWSTRDAVDGAEAVATSVATGTVTRFAASSRVYADSNNTQFLHNATMFGLEAGGAYTYVLTSASGSASDIHRFTLQPVAATGPWGAGRDYPVLAIYGDMGVAVNAHKTLPLLTADVEAGRFDAILHVGDIAYDLQSNSGANGDAFVVQMEPIAGAVPVHLCPGNVSSRPSSALCQLLDNLPPPCLPPSLLLSTPHTTAIAIAIAIAARGLLGFRAVPRAL